MCACKGQVKRRDTVAAVAVVQKRVRKTLGNVEQVRRGLERKARRIQQLQHSNAVPGASQNSLRKLFSCLVFVCCGLLLGCIHVVIRSIAGGNGV